jgi:hypothetical protein
MRKASRSKGGAAIINADVCVATLRCLHSLHKGSRLFPNRNSPVEAWRGECSSVGGKSCAGAQGR